MIVEQLTLIALYAAELNFVENLFSFAVYIINVHLHHFGVSFLIRIPFHFGLGFLIVFFCQDVLVDWFGGGDLAR